MQTSTFCKNSKKQVHENLDKIKKGIRRLLPNATVTIEENALFVVLPLRDIVNALKKRIYDSLKRYLPDAKIESFIDTETDDPKIVLVFGR